MSVVTDILLCTALDDGGMDYEHPNVDALSAWLVNRYGPACTLKKLSDKATGNKAMQADVFGCAVNYCDTDALVEAFQAIQWESRECAQLLLKHEEWDAFRLYAAIGQSPAEQER